MMFSISEFSKSTGLSVKALRIYHEKQILVPSSIDSESGYRYYDDKNLEKARAIVLLREMMFSLDEIKNIFSECGDDGDAISFLEVRKIQLEAKIREMNSVTKSLGKLIENEKQARSIIDGSDYRIEEKTIPHTRIAGIRIKGKYSQSGDAFSRLGKKVGRYISGKAMNLFYDNEYKDDDADFESCFPIRKASSVDGVSIRDLPGGKAITLIHRGPYSQLGRSYAKIFSFIKEKDYITLSPMREIYLKGPGIIFNGNPTKYLTEIQAVVSTENA